MDPLALRLLTFDVEQGHSNEMGRCVVMSITFVDGLAFSQYSMTPARARLLGRDLMTMAARLDADNAVARGDPAPAARR